MMSLDEAIKHAEEVAEENQAIVDSCDYYGENMAKCEKCAEEHRQLAEWLKELKACREQERILDKIKAEIEQIEPYDLRWDKRTPEYIKDMVLGIIDKYTVQVEIQADYDRQKASGMTDEEWEYAQAEDAYDKVLAYLEANVNDFPDYHEAIEAVLEMKGGE